MSMESTLGGRRDFEPFFHTGLGGEQFRENVLAFCERHGFSVSMGGGSPSPEFEATLGDAADRGVDVLLNVGGPSEAVGTDADLVDSEEAMAAHRDRLREVTELYAEYFPKGRLYVWHEAPIHGNWRQQESLSTVARRREMAENIVENGAKIFPTEREVIKDVRSTLDVGTFVHHPLLPSEAHTEMPVFTRLMNRLKEMGSLPDFTYCDIYRGYYEWEGGYDGINDYIEDIVRNTREATRDRPVHILLQAHTINNYYTPSKQAIVGNAQSAMDGGADGVGWYFRGGFRETHSRNYNPFVPNRGDVDEDQFNSWTGSRDRLAYASLLLAEQRPEFDPDERFDLLVYGHDFDFYEHRVSLRRDGDWEFVGDVSGYADGENPYSGGDRDRVCAFHALDRVYLDGGLDVRIESDGDGDGGRLHGVYALPYAGTPRFYTEGDASGWADDLASVALAVNEERSDLSPGDTVTRHLLTGEPSSELTSLVYPDAAADLTERVANERGTASSYRDRFDLWLYGRDLSDAVVSLGDREITCALGADGDREALLARGLSLEEFVTDHRAGCFIDLRVETNGADLRAAYAVPAHGAANYLTPAEAAAVVDAEYTEGHGQLTRFSLGNAFWPDGTTDVDTAETFVHVGDRTIVECDPVPDLHPIYSSTQW